MSIANEDPTHDRRLTIAHYHAWKPRDMLLPGTRAELIEGKITGMPSAEALHTAEVDRLNRILSRDVGDRAIVRCRGPIPLWHYSEPVPDIALLVPNDTFYRLCGPEPSEVLLVVEVSEEEVEYETDVKLPLYARHGIPELWVFNLPRRMFIRHRYPAGERYRQVMHLDTRGPTGIAALPGVRVDLSSMFY